MKTNFKKTLAVLLAVLMLSSVFSVTAFAATYTGKISPGTASGVTLKEGITEDMLTFKRGEQTITLTLAAEDGVIKLKEGEEVLASGAVIIGA